eukprot:CAMPEP_0116909890 /NCGR_PEP_ID=MMETSP0467-20121206/14552_1 /TAXON_ID=283647 /ORGANISM="Mesodinium pulex, Strain SPMC105" /LENGTH=69 /DNA_ID=CAMNT_0004585349 /DNA_START=674 /DNA_END=883 /DNA_ORIENTATION=+
MIGQTLSEDIIGDPVSYFLGEVDVDDMDEFDDEDDEEEDHKPHNHKGKGKPQIQSEKGAKQNKEECKNN